MFRPIRRAIFICIIGLIIFNVTQVSTGAETSSPEAQSNHSQFTNITETKFSDGTSKYTTYKCPVNKSTGTTSKNSDVDEEVAGFTLLGKHTGQRLTIQDLGVLRCSPTRRYIPLLRLLKALDIEKTEEKGLIRFTPDSAQPVIIDLNKELILIDDQDIPVDMVVMASDINREREIYLPPETVSELFEVELKWSEENYEFIARTNHKLHIWKASASLFAILAQEVPANLPEALPPAHPKDFSLDFMEFRLRSKIISEENLSSTSKGIDALRQTLWGNMFGGTFKIQLSEPPIIMRGTRSGTGSTSSAMLDRGEWLYRTPDTEVSVGDSAFGLNDLTFPYIRITGVRVNGISGGVTGQAEEEKTWNSPSPGMRAYFVHPRVFEGLAPKGSQVELVINDRLIDSQEVVSDGHAPAGMGKYSFEEIILPPGSLSDIRITITDPSGFKTYIQKYISENSNLLPQGRLAYLGGMGTSREIQTWDSHGMFGGGRVLYGVTNSLAIGGTAAIQQGIYNPLVPVFFDTALRQFPDHSTHIGSQLLWQPNAYVFLGGDVSVSSGKSADSRNTYNDSAVKIKGELYPGKNTVLTTQVFRYGPDFFDGNDTRLHDRQGYAINGKWGLHSDWLINTSFGRVGNNTRGNLPQTFTVDFQNLKITSRAIPSTSLTVGADRIAPAGNNPTVLYLLKLQVHPFSGINFYSDISAGGSMVLNEHQDFFSSMKIPELDTLKGPSTSAILSTSLNDKNELALSYRRSMNRERSSIIQNFHTLSKHPLRIRSELGFDIDTRNSFLENRTEYIFDSSGNKSIELVSRFEQDKWGVSLLINFTELISFNKGTPVLLADKHINADNGGIQGRVFMDYNANAHLDPDEPGVENVKIIIGNNYCITDKDGYFILPGLSQPGKVKVFLDLNSIPAVYSPTHGMQTAYVNPGALTEVNLGIIPANSVSGFIIAGIPESKEKPLAGVRVNLIGHRDGKMVTDSVTAGDGSYYLGDIRPGEYILKVDTDTLSRNCILSDYKRELTILPDKEPQELTLSPIHAACGVNQ